MGLGAQPQKTLRVFKCAGYIPYYLKMRTLDNLQEAGMLVLPKRAKARDGLTLATDGYPRGQNNIPASHKQR